MTSSIGALPICQVSLWGLMEGSIYQHGAHGLILSAAQSDIAQLCHCYQMNCCQHVVLILFTWSQTETFSRRKCCPKSTQFFCFFDIVLSMRKMAVFAFLIVLSKWFFARCCTIRHHSALPLLSFKLVPACGVFSFYLVSNRDFFVEKVLSKVNTIFFLT